MPFLENRTYIDGIDLWTNFNMFIEKGMASVLRYPPKKEGISHDWQDQNGIDYDTSKIYFKERDITLQMSIVCVSEADFWVKHDNFITMLTQPGVHRLEHSAYGLKQYFVIYKDTTNYQQIKPLTNDAGTQTIAVASKFTLVLTEPSPSPISSDNDLTFIVDEMGRFLVT